MELRQSTAGSESEIDDLDNHVSIFIEADEYIVGLDISMGDPVLM